MDRSHFGGHRYTSLVFDAYYTRNGNQAHAGAGADGTAAGDHTGLAGAA